MGNKDNRRNIVAETDHDGVIGRIVLATHGDVILQLARNRLYGQSRLPGFIFPTEVHRRISISRLIAAIVHLGLLKLLKRRMIIRRHALQRYDLIMLHTTSWQLDLILLTVLFHRHLLGVSGTCHTLIDTQRQGEDNRYNPTG